ncbi:unnamed protein product [Zymoseptoria tritici ST99CH_3D1]|nr:unnamed protein product [Zymoseptoria tritici ST99CH_3D1]
MNPISHQDQVSEANTRMAMDMARKAAADLSTSLQGRLHLAWTNTSQDEPPNGTSAESPFVSLFDEAFEDIESPFVYATGMAFDQLNSAVPHAQELQGLKERIRIQTEGIEKLTAEHGKVKEERRKLDIHLQEVLDSNDESLKRVDMLVQAGVTLPRWVMELAEELRNDKVQLQAELNAAYGKESDTDAVRQGELAAAGTKTVAN